MMNPYQDDATVKTIGNLSIENGKEIISIHGSLDIPFNKEGQHQAIALKECLDSIVAAFENAPSISEDNNISTPQPHIMKNPFVKK